MSDDPYRWLEATDGQDVLDWVRRHNAPTLARLSGERLEQMRAEALDVFDSDDRIPVVGREGEYLYNFWRDTVHPRGLWRRTTLEEYRKDSPEWDVIIDVDALAAAEDENWVWGGAGINAPGYTCAVVSLSRGGSDASIVREFDMTTRQFVADGFNLPEAKSDIDFEDDDTVLVATDFGEGSLTDSGYPRLIKRWRRGAPLEDAELVFVGSASDVAVGMNITSDPGFERTLLFRMLDFYNKETFELRDGELIRLDIPTDCSMAVHREWAMILLISDWTRGDTTYKADSVLIADYEQLVAGTPELHVVFDPDGEEFLAGGAFTGDRFLSIKLRDVATVVEVVTPGTWEFEPLPGVPDNATVGLVSFDQQGDEIFLSASGFDRPQQLLHGASAGPVSVIKSSPSMFDADDIVVTQHFAASADGTKVPYFLVSHRDSAGPGPTLLDGYGAFRVAQLPGYLRGARPPLAGPRRLLCAGEHSRRRGVRAGLARADGTPEPTQGGGGLRRRRTAFGRPWRDDRQTTRCHGRQRGRPADRSHVDAVSRPVRSVDLRQSAAGHAPLSRAAGRRLVDGRVRRP